MPEPGLPPLESHLETVGVILKILVFNNEGIRVPAERQPWSGCRAPRRALVIVTDRGSQPLQLLHVTNFDTKP